MIKTYNGIFDKLANTAGQLTTHQQILDYFYGMLSFLGCTFDEQLAEPWPIYAITCKMCTLKKNETKLIYQIKKTEFNLKNTFIN